MTVYCVSYDLNRPGQNYEKLYEQIKSLGNWWHCLDSTWLVHSSLSALDVANYLWRVMDPNDKLLVTQVGQPALVAWVGFDKACADWLLANL